MKTMISTLALALALVQVSRADDVKPAESVAPAGRGNGAQLEKRVEKQHKRINHLKDKGKISPEQAASLNQKVDGVEAKVQEAKKDGITQEERKEIREELKATREEIKKARKTKK